MFVYMSVTDKVLISTAEAKDNESAEAKNKESSHQNVPEEHDFPQQIHIRLQPNGRKEVTLAIDKHDFDEIRPEPMIEPSTRDTTRSSDQSKHMETNTINQMYKSQHSRDPVKVAKIDSDFQIHGSFCIDGQLYVIRPESADDKSSRHYVEQFQCPLDDNVYEVEDNANELTEDRDIEHKYVRLKRSETRHKRELTALTVELLLVIDFAAFEWWDTLTFNTPGHTTNTLDRIEEYYGYVFNGINTRLQNIDKNFNITAALSGMYIAKTEEESFWTLSSTLEVDADSPRIMVNSSEALDKFQTWLDGQDNLPHYDHAILFTGTNLSYAGSAGNTGLAFGHSMCLNISNSSIVEDVFDFRTVTYATQQVARSLGSRDDMDNNDCLEFFNYIMVPKFKLPLRSFPSNRWKFSACSQQYIKEYTDELNMINMNCLLATKIKQHYPEHLQYMTTELPGFHFKAKTQCQQKFGPTSDVCRIGIGTSYSKICAGLLCTLPGTDACDYILPSDGTPCGNKKYCWQGACEEFEDGQETSDTCAFGNTPTINCNKLVREDIAVCYNETIRHQCCKSCELIAMDFPGCEYGDRSPDCRIGACINGDETYVSTTCCLTCWDGPTPYMPSFDQLLADISSTFPYMSVGHTTEQSYPNGHTTDRILSESVSPTSFEGEAFYSSTPYTSETTSGMYSSDSHGERLTTKFSEIKDSVKDGMGVYLTDPNKGSNNFQRTGPVEKPSAESQERNYKENNHRRLTGHVKTSEDDGVGANYHGGGDQNKGRQLTSQCDCVNTEGDGVGTRPTFKSDVHASMKDAGCSNKSGIDRYC